MMNLRSNIPIIDSADHFARIFDVSRETLERLKIYENLLIRWQRAHNLVAPKTLDMLWSRHMADSAQLLQLRPEAQRWLDLGSGGGFPGLVIAILSMEKGSNLPLHVDLVESNSRKCAFMNAVRRETGAPVQVHNIRVEAMSKETAKPYDVVSARALAPLTLLLDYAFPFIAAGAVGLFPKGQDVDGELTAAARYWIINSESVPSLTDPAGRILIVNSCQKRTGE